MEQRGRNSSSNKYHNDFLYTPSTEKQNIQIQAHKYTYMYMGIRPVLHLFKFLTDYSFLEKNNHNRYYLISRYYAKHYIKHLHI